MEQQMIDVNKRELSNIRKALKQTTPYTVLREPFKRALKKVAYYKGDLLGKSGSGKTTILYAIAQALMILGYKVCIATEDVNTLCLYNDMEANSNPVPIFDLNSTARSLPEIKAIKKYGIQSCNVRPSSVGREVQLKKADSHFTACSVVLPREYADIKSEVKIAILPKVTKLLEDVDIILVDDCSHIPLQIAFTELHRNSSKVIFCVKDEKTKFFPKGLTYYTPVRLNTIADLTKVVLNIKIKCKQKRESVETTFLLSELRKLSTLAQDNVVVKNILDTAIQELQKL